MVCMGVWVLQWVLGVWISQTEWVWRVDECLQPSGSSKPPSPKPSKPPASRCTVTVQQGDSMWSIAQVRCASPGVLHGTPSSPEVEPFNGLQKASATRLD